MMTITSGLSITCGQSNTDNAAAELEVREHFRDAGFPGSMRGRFVGVSLERLLRFAFGRDVRVAFRGGLYRFANIDGDGSFTLLHRVG